MTFSTSASVDPVTCEGRGREDGHGRGVHAFCRWPSRRRVSEKAFPAADERANGRRRGQLSFLRYGFRPEPTTRRPRRPDPASRTCPSGRRRSGEVCEKEARDFTISSHPLWPTRGHVKLFPRSRRGPGAVDVGRGPVLPRRDGHPIASADGAEERQAVGDGSPGGTFPACKCILWRVGVRPVQVRGDRRRGVCCSVGGSISVVVGELGRVVRRGCLTDRRGRRE